MKGILIQFLKIVSHFPSFSFSYLEGSILIVEYKNINIFCYKPKYVDFSLPKVLPSFSKLKPLDIKAKAEEIITINKHNFHQEEYIKYYIASVALISKGVGNKFEADLIACIRSALGLTTSKSFWHIFIAENFAFEKDSIKNSPNSSLIHF